VEKRQLGRRVADLREERLNEICIALSYALGCQGR